MPVVRDGRVSLLGEEMLIIFEERAHLDTKKIKWQILQSVIRDVRCKTLCVEA